MGLNGFDISMLALVKEMAKAETYFILWTKLVWFAAFYNRMGAQTYSLANCDKLDS